MEDEDEGKEEAVTRESDIGEIGCWFIYSFGYMV